MSYLNRSMQRTFFIAVLLCGMGVSGHGYAAMAGKAEAPTPASYVYFRSGNPDNILFNDIGGAISHACRRNPHELNPSLYTNGCPNGITGGGPGITVISYDWEVIIETGYPDDTGSSSVGVQASPLDQSQPQPDTCENPTHQDGMDTDGNGQPNICLANNTRNPTEQIDSDAEGPCPALENPVDCTNGDKTQREVIYAGPDGLTLTLDYSSRTGAWRTGYGLWLEGVDEPTIDAKALHIPGGFVNGYYLVETLPDGTRIFRADSAAQGELQETSSGTYSYRDSSGVVHRFNGFGYVEQITQRDGRSESFAYVSGQEANGQIATVTNSFGRTLTFTYDTNGLIDTVTDPDSRVYDLDFAANGNLQQISWPDANGDPLDNPVKQFLYEDTNFPNALTGIIDEHGTRFATYAYDPVSGKATLTEHAGGAQKLTLDYVTEELVTPDGYIVDARRTDVVEFIDATLSHTRVYTFQKFRGIERITQIQTLPCPTCAPQIETWEYDPISGFLTRYTDAEGHITDYLHNSRGLEERRTDGVGTVDARTVTTVWHPDFDQPTLVTEPDRTTAYSYNSAGQVLTETITGLTSGATQVTTYTYQTINGISLLNSIDGPRTDVSDITTLYYDALGNLTSVENALGHTTTITSRDTAGRPTGLSDANGLITTLTYDARGRLATRTEGATRQTTFGYDAAGNINRITPPDGSFIDYGYDAAQRLTSITDSFGHQIVYTLNARGERTAERVYDPTSTLRRQIDRVYNSLGQLSDVIGASGQTWQYSYDKVGNRINRIDPRNNTTQFAFDALNRLITVTDDLNNNSGYQYDDQDQLTQVTDPNGNPTGYQYDDLGNLLSLTSPDTGITTYSNYDGAGNAGQMTDANNNTTTYTYDALNRLTLATYQDGTTTQYLYDDALTNGTGRLSQLIDPSGTTNYQYNPFGDVTQLTQTIGNQTFTTVYQYNPFGQLSGIDYPSGMSVAYSYSQGRISGIDINGAPLLNTITYYPFGPAESWSWGNGAATSRSFDLDGQMSQYRLNGDSQTLGYDLAGNLQTRTNTLGTLTYGYDDLNRLTSVTGLQTQAFQYDANGNRTQLTDGTDISSYTIAANSNRITEISGVQANVYTYDNNGNILSDGANSFVYNARNRMASANGIQYLHNGLGQRTARQTGTGLYHGDASNDGLIDQADFDQTVTAILGTATPTGNTDCNNDGQTNVIDLVCLNNLIATATPPQEILNSTYFVYDLQGQLIGEYDNNGDPIQETVYFGTLPVATVKNSTVYYIHTDQLNTPRAISDANNITLWQWVSTPFGETAANEDVDGDGVTFQFNLRFPGQYYDEESGLHYNYFRDYDPTTGRYVESDPIGLEAGLNTYGYVEGNPLRFIDTLGLAGVMPTPFPGQSPARHGSGFAGSLGGSFCPPARSIKKNVKPRGLSQNRNLQELTHQDLVKTFKGTGFDLSNHAIKRLKDPRTQRLGFKTPNDIVKIFNKGKQFDAGNGEIGFRFKGLEAIVNPKTKRVVTFRPSKNRGL